MEVTHNHNAKSQLAKLLATENITVQHNASAKTAYFDVKTRVLTLPVWREMSNDLYDLLVVHEVGHALDTPIDGWIDAITDIAKRITGSTSNRAVMAVKGFLNVIEDARIDKRQKRRFPGARRNYVKGYAELIEKDFFGTVTKDVNAMSFIDRVNIYCKGGSMLGIKFTAEERAILSKIEKAETFDEVMALTEEVFRWSKEKHEEQEQEMEDFRAKSAEMTDDDENDSEFEYGDDEADDDQQFSGRAAADDDDEEIEDDDSEMSEADDDGEEKSDDPINIGAQKQKQNSDEYVPESETEKIWNERQSELMTSSDEEYVYIKIPRPVNYDRVVNDYKIVLKQQRQSIANNSEEWLSAIRRELQEFKSAENASISFMVKEFEMRKSADEYARTSVSKTGVIDTNKLHSYKYNDDLFRRITSVATGKNHGFVMFLDWSGSMDHNIKKTVKQLITLTMFCKRVQIPFEVYTFRSVVETDHLDISKMFSKNKNDINFDGFVARNILSSRMNVAEYNEAVFNLYVAGCSYRMSCDPMNATPLNMCIATADLIVNRFKAKSKVQIVNTIFLTDGESDPLYGICGFTKNYGKRYRYILQDEITKKDYTLRSSYGDPLGNKDTTGLLLRILKERIGGNLIGFYISNDGFSRSYYDVTGNSSGNNLKSLEEEWRVNGFFGVTSYGYDEYYVLNAKSFDITKNNLKVDSTMTKRKIASEFIKFSEKKTVSRVLLSRFVKRIAA